MLQRIICILFAIITSFAITQPAYSAYTTKSFIDPACIAAQNNKNNTITVSIFSNNRLSTPNFFELRIEIQKNITKFLSTRVKGINIATGQPCTNVISDSGCTVTRYSNTDGTPVTPNQIYNYVVFTMLYQYISQDILDKGQLETLRAEFSKGYSDPTSPLYNESLAKIGKETFEFRAIAAINETALKGDVNSLNNKSSQDIANIIDSSSTKIAEQVSDDALFFQKAGYSSLVRFPITSRLVECLDGTFRNLFMRDLPTSRQTPFRISQDYFKPAVILALILYFIAYGYKILMARGLGKQSDIFIFAIKFGLVFYFSIGDAWKDFGFDFIKSITATVGKIVFESMPSSADGCAIFSPTMYPQGKGFLAFFDIIDCKFANYIGLMPDKSFPAIFTPLTIPMLVPIPIIGLLVTTITSVYLVMIVYLVLSGIEIYISSMLFTAFYLFLSPVIVPMVLFDQTDEIFKAYQSKIVSCIVQGAMATIFIVTIVSLMDGIIYGPNPTGQKLFKSPSQAFINGIPQPNQLSSDCYGGSAKSTEEDGHFWSTVPIACHLAIMSLKEIQWIAFPVPEVVELFHLPIGIVAVKLVFEFLFPCVITIVMLLIVQKVISETKTIIDKISGATSIESFGSSDKLKGVTDTAQSAISASWSEGKQLYNTVTSDDKKTKK